MMMGLKSYQLARIVCALLTWMIVLVPTSPAQAKPPQDRVAMLRRGVNITHWFRYPPSGDPDALANYLSDTTLDQLHWAGFTFLRIPVQPELIASSPRILAALTKAVRRAEQRGFAVIVALAPTTWHLESNAGDRDALFAAWNRLGPALRGLPADRTFAELLNEPVFPNDAGAWARLQERLLAAVRTLLPSTTIILTGNDWGSVRGLTALTPAADSNVIYSVHFYEPPELTSLAAWQPSADRAVLARLPFPVDDATSCAAGLGAADAATAGIWRFYCAQGWNGESIAKQLAPAADWARRNGSAVFVGEFGASARLNSPARLAWLRAVRRACEENGMDWALWGYDDIMGFDVHVAGGGAVLDPAVLSSLGLDGPPASKSVANRNIGGPSQRRESSVKIKSPRS